MERNDDFGIGSPVTGDMPWEGVHIIHDDSTVSLCSAAADSFPEGDFNAGGFSLKRPEHKQVPFREIKPCPVDSVEFLPEQGGSIGEIRRQMRHTCRQ